MQVTATAAAAEINVTAVAAVLIFCKSLKYFGELPYVSDIMAALSKGTPKTVSMLLVFVVLLLGHALAFYLAFAIDVYQARARGCSALGA